MNKKEFTKRAGQIYAQGIQYGYTDEQMIKFLNSTFEVFLEPKKEQYYQIERVKKLVGYEK